MNLNRLKGEIVATYGTQNEFARAMHWHKNKVSKLVCGKYKPDTDEVADITTALNLDKEKYCEIFLTKKSPNGDR